MNSLRISRPVLPLVLHWKPAAVCHTPPPVRRFYHIFFHAPGDGSNHSLQARLYQHIQPRNKQQQQQQEIGWQERVRAAILVAGAAASCLCSRESVPYTDRTRLIIVSPKIERWLGRRLFNIEKPKLGSKVMPPLHPESVRVRRIASEIVAAAVHRNDEAEAPLMSNEEEKEPRRPRGGVINDDWEVIVVKDKRVNAMCAPGGKIIVFTGLLDVFREDTEVATVLGHEVGHAVARHCAEKLTSVLWIIAQEIVIVQFIDIPNKMLDVMSKYLLHHPFSRRMEMEADHVGLMLLAAAGYDPRVAPSVYEKLGKIGGDAEAHKGSPNPDSKPNCIEVT